MSASTPAIITCLPSAEASGQKVLNECTAHARSSIALAHMHAVLDGEAVAGPSAKVAERGKANGALAFDRDEDRITLGLSGGEPCAVDPPG